MKEKSNTIDNMLKTEGQQVIARAVASLPDESLSLVWRSDLNEALRERAVSVRRRKTFLNIFSPVAGFGLACALAVVVLIRPTQSVIAPTVSSPAAPQASLEASLVQLHQDDLRSADVAGTGLNPTEAVNDVSTPVPVNSSDSPEDDLEF